MYKSWLFLEIPKNFTVPEPIRDFLYIRKGKSLYID